MDIQPVVRPARARELLKVRPPRLDRTELGERRRTPAEGIAALAAGVTGAIAALTRALAVELAAAA